MKTYDLIDALGSLDDETVLSARKAPVVSVGTGHARPRTSEACPYRENANRTAFRRIPGAALIAAILAVVLSLGAVAYYVISHPNTAALMEAGPMTNGRVPVTIDETGQKIIDSAAIDLNLSQTSNGTTVTVDSLMGCTDPRQSMFYLTFTVKAPEGYEFPDNLSNWCFWNNRFTIVPDDLPLGRVETAVKNPDGTASVLWLVLPEGSPEGHKLHIAFDGFGTASKEVARDLSTGAREIELPGTWTFDFDLPALPETQEIRFDAAAVKAAGLPMTALRLTSFGGVAELETQALSRLGQFRAAYGAQLKAEFPTVDFDRMDDAEFEALCENGDLEGFLTAEEFARLHELLSQLPPVDLSIARPETVTLEYPDGTEYTVSFGEYGDNLWLSLDAQMTPYCTIVFNNPQPISQATAIVINGIRIPLREAP